MISFDYVKMEHITEELSHFALECEILWAPEIGKLFINVYEDESHDTIPIVLIFFYKAIRAFLRARLSALHLLEKRYLVEKYRWKNRCEEYLQITNANCTQLLEEEKSHA